MEPADLLRTSAVRPVEQAGQRTVVDREPRPQHVGSTEEVGQRPQVQLEGGRDEHHGVTRRAVRVEQRHRVGTHPVIGDVPCEFLGVGFDAAVVASASPGSSRVRLRVAAARRANGSGSDSDELKRTESITCSERDTCDPLLRANLRAGIACRAL